MEQDQTQCAATEPWGYANLINAMEEALSLAANSPDPSTQNGAVLIGPAGDVICGDHNHFPKGVRQSPERWKRPLKYSFVEHAERNVIYSAARQGIPTEGTTIVCPWAACTECARAIVQAGIRTCVRLPLPGGTWAESIAIGDIIFEESGVHIVTLDLSLIKTSSLRHNGQVINASARCSQ